MARRPQLRLFSEESFLSEVPTEVPTVSQQRKFYAPDRPEDVSRQWHIHSQLSKVVGSVFEEAQCDTLCHFITPNHTKSRSKVVYPESLTCGIYLKSALADAATTLAKDDRQSSHLRPELLKHFRRCSYHYSVTVPIIVECGNRFRSLANDAMDLVNARNEEDLCVENDALFDEDDSDELLNLQEVMFDVFKYQHRTFSFAISIFGDTCRLLRFDHSEAVATMPFKWTSTQSTLHTFLWKIARMDNGLIDLGYDPSAVVASDGERAMFAAMASTPFLPQELRTYVEQATADSAPVYKVTVTTAPPTDDEGLPDVPVTADKSLPDTLASNVPEADAGPRTHGPPRYRMHTFLIGDPLFAAEALVGRCTKGYVAYRLDEDVPVENRLCFLKDCWRPYVAGRTRPEHLVYERLHSHSVQLIASLICGGDVGGPRAQQTTVQNFLSDEVHQRPVPRVHYRLVTQEVGIPVTEFKSFQELAGVFAAALAAHSEAWNKAQLLHRDISVGNIMIDPNSRRGFLIDWDLSRFEPELGKGPVEPDRSGTWQYRSALLLQFPRKPCRPSDDMESFVHAFRQLVLRFTRTSVTETLLSHVTTTYEEYFQRDGVLMGGQCKLSQFWYPHPPFDVVGDVHLQELLDAVAKGCYSFYDQVKLPHMQAFYGIEVKNEAQIKPRTDPVDVNFLKRLRDAIPNAAPSVSSIFKHPVSVTSHPASLDEHDPCEVDGFLSSHSGLLDYLVQYAVLDEVHVRGEDYFKKYMSDLREASTSTRNLSRSNIGSLSMAGSVSSSLPLNRRLQLPRVPIASSGESVRSGSSLDSLSRKHARQDEGEGTSMCPVGEVSGGSKARAKSRAKQAKDID
ncbi:hypothetical protein C8Q80DRAFT_327456 [Daedaleopsis nitida]|nr:hypothetical protein C8Q80DRAFT_327456 [Daedaleopsis nitida]